jgi:hypothetical protein
LVVIFLVVKSGFFFGYGLSYSVTVLGEVFDFVCVYSDGEVLKLGVSVLCGDLWNIG